MKKKTFRPFKEARKFAHALNLKGQSEWREHWKTHKRPANVTGFPDRTYKNDWKGWGDFLGTGKLSTKEMAKNWLPAKEARIEIARLAKDVFGGKGFSRQDWYKAYDEGKIPKNIPKYLNEIYNPNSNNNRRRKKK